MSNLPEGWYPNPSDPTTEIFWNGTGWSGDVRQVTDDPAAAPSASADSRVTPAHQTGTEVPQANTESPRSPRGMAKRLPLWLRVAIPAAALVLVAVLVVVLVQPRGAAVAESACRAAAVDGMRAPSEATIVGIETRSAPVDGEKDDEWVDFLLGPVGNGTLDQLSGLSRATDPFLVNSGSEGALFEFEPNVYIAVGKIDGTNGFGAITRQHFLCGVAVEGTDVTQETRIAYFG